VSQDPILPLPSDSLLGVGLDIRVIGYVWCWVRNDQRVDVLSTITLEPYAGRVQVLSSHRAQGVFRRWGDFVVLTPPGPGKYFIAQFPALIHHCDQQGLVREGLGGFELGFEPFPPSY